MVQINEYLRWVFFGATTCYLKQKVFLLCCKKHTTLRSFALLSQSCAAYARRHLVILVKHDCPLIKNGESYSSATCVTLLFFAFQVVAKKIQF